MLSEFAVQPSVVDARKARLKEIIKDKSLLTDGHFRLASGSESGVFFDMKPTLLDPEGANLAADIILDMLESEDVDAIGGLVIGACPIVSAVCVKSHPRRPIHAFYVRKEPKDRGTQRLIEGDPLEPGSHVVLVDDVTTKGGSTLRAVKAVGECGAHVSKVIAIVDRQEGAEEILQKQGIELVPLFKMEEFLR